MKKLHQAGSNGRMLVPPGKRFFISGVALDPTALFLLLVLCLCAPSMAKAQRQVSITADPALPIRNLLRNPGFEEGSAAGTYFRKKCMNSSPILERLVPPVAGIDLEQALNYVSADNISIDFFYEGFTYPRVFYRRGSRPVLERFIEMHCTKSGDPLEVLSSCVDAVSRCVKHYVFLPAAGPADSAPSEEQLLKQGAGWCNEQARLLCAITQILGMPSRIVFAKSIHGAGHVVSEVYVNGAWVLVDQSVGYVFRVPGGRTVNVRDLWKDAAMRSLCNDGYLARIDGCRPHGTSVDAWRERISWAREGHPCDLFTHVGYCNYFIY